MNRHKSKPRHADPEFHRTIVFGNTASGKSWLSRALGAKTSIDVVDLDQIRWVGGDYSRKETVQTAIEKTTIAASADRWIIEGVYGWLVRPIIDRATCVVWTDIPWEESRENLFKRETALGDAGNFEELEEWSSAYWARETQSSFQAHLDLYENFEGPKYRLANMKETTGFIEMISSAY